MPDGGTIVLGIDEAGGAFNVTGIPDIAIMDAGVTAQSRAAVTPCPTLFSQTFTMEGKSVLVLHVAPLSLSDKPARVHGDAYLRQSDGDYKMNPHELRMLEVAQLHADQRIDYDVQPIVGLTENDLVPELVYSYIEAVKERDKRLRDRNHDEILRATSVLTAAGEPTLAGLYTLGDYPQGRFPSLTVTAAVQIHDASGQNRNRNLEDFTGPVPILLHELMGWVRRNLGTVQQYQQDGSMVRTSELPLTAVRELIANALVHRDLGPNTLGTGKGIQVRLTERTLFIQSPGGLQGLSLAQLESTEHAQAAVNQRLYAISKKLSTPDGASVIEGEGGGIKEVFRSAQQQGLSRPQLIDTGVQFKALLWRPTPDNYPHSNIPARNQSITYAKPIEEESELPLSSSPTRHEKIVVKQLSSGESLSLTEIATASGLKVNQVRYVLRPLQAEGIVEMEGGRGRRDTKYALTKGRRNH